MDRQTSLTIGGWCADPATNELRRDGARVRIEPKAMDVLVMLAERAGRVVSREQLFSCVWPGVVVGDEALSQSIAKLRRALGDDAQAPAYIETIARRGYRLKAPVRHETAQPRQAAAAGKPLAPWLATAAIAIAGAAAALSWHLERDRAAASPASHARVDDAKPSLTVLPFESVGAGPGESYLARGIGDELMTHLGTVSGLRVIAPGGEPAGRYTVAGSVQREAGRLRIYARLVDTRSGEQLWSERYDRGPGDLLEVEDEIAGRIAQALPARLTDVERRRVAKRYTASLEAYDDFLRAQSLFLARGATENLDARALYRKAIEIDPAFARAYAGLAMTYALDPRLRGAASEADLRRAQVLAETAMQIDPDIAEVHWALGFVHAQRREHVEAIAALERAVALNPSYADAYALMGGIRTYMGQPSASIPLLREALRLNPAGGHLYYLLLGRAYFFEGDLEQAFVHLRAAAQRNPADLETHVYLAAAAAAAGDRAAAEWQAQEVRMRDPRFTARQWLQTYPLASPTLRARLAALLSTAGL